MTGGVECLATKRAHGLSEEGAAVARPRRERHRKALAELERSAVEDSCNLGWVAVVGARLSELCESSEAGLGEGEEERRCQLPSEGENDSRSSAGKKERLARGERHHARLRGGKGAVTR